MGQRNPLRLCHITAHPNVKAVFTILGVDAPAFHTRIEYENARLPNGSRALLVGFSLIKTHVATGQLVFEAL
jgi:hypothetical protein